MSKMQEGYEEYRRKVREGEISLPVPDDPLEKAQKHPTSLRAAINAKCYDCVCFQRKEVTLCEMDDCPLWSLRPWQKKNG